MKPTRQSGWGTATDTGPIRRRLKETTFWDRILIAVLAFVLGAVVTGFGYLYLSTRTERFRDRKTKLERLTGNEARMHYVTVCGIGGVVAVVGYIMMALRDPYGSARKEEDQAEIESAPKADRFDFMKNRD